VVVVSVTCRTISQNLHTANKHKKKDNNSFFLFKNLFDS
jgi:hypothetical protein